MAAKDPDSLARTLAQAKDNAANLEETAVDPTYAGGNFRKAGDIFRHGPPGGTFRDYLTEREGEQAAQEFVGLLQEGLFPVVPDGGFPPPGSRSEEVG